PKRSSTSSITSRSTPGAPMARFSRSCRKTPDFSYTPGAAGAGEVKARHDRYPTHRLTLQQTSSGNSVLGALHLASVKAGGIKYPVTWKDGNGTTKGACLEAVILKTPDETYATELGTVVWEIGLKNPERFVGGH